MEHTRACVGYTRTHVRFDYPGLRCPEGGYHSQVRMEHWQITGIRHTRLHMFRVLLEGRRLDEMACAASLIDDSIAHTFDQCDQESRMGVLSL